MRLSDQTLTRLRWQERALCASEEPGMFFPEARSGEGKKLCGRCTVRSECLGFALDEGMAFGIWGGMTPKERQRLQTSGLTEVLMGKGYMRRRDDGQ